MADSFGKTDQWEEYDPSELRAVASSILYLAKRTGHHSDAQGVPTPADTKGIAGSADGEPRS